MGSPRPSPARGARPLAALVLLVPLLGACAGASAPGAQEPSPEVSPMTRLNLSSPAFGPGGPIPRRHTCDGPDLSPPLAWTPGPQGTAAYALLVDDPDARGFVHWVAFDIPATTTTLPEGASPSPAFKEGRNDFGRIGWGGPCPPAGTHRYVFSLFALDRPLGLPRGATAAEVRRAVAGHVLAQGTLVGTYRRG